MNSDVKLVFFLLLSKLFSISHSKLNLGQNSKWSGSLYFRSWFAWKTKYWRLKL